MFPCHIIIKTINIQNKERILRAAKETGQVTYKGRPIKITPDFSMKTMKVRRSWSSVMQTLRDHRCQPRLLYPAKLSITIDDQNKIFHDRTRFIQYLATNPTLRKYQKKNSNPRMLVTSTRRQTTDDLTAANPKGKKHTK